MNILHYSLGLSPYRSGGLTKYSMDLMLNQIDSGYKVSLLYPGHYNLLIGTKIIKENCNLKIELYELVNPLPVPLLGGIKRPNIYCKKINSGCYNIFLKEIKPDVIHIHTLMGLHKEFFIAAKKLNIKIIFTTHDYYGICPRVNLIDRHNSFCDDFEDGVKCIDCNKNAYDMKLIYLMQSGLYKHYKECSLVKKLRNFKKVSLGENRINDLKDNNIKVKPEDYLKLRQYYISIFDLIDYFHFNSSVARAEYQKYFECRGEVLNITHNDITDNRLIKNYGLNSKLRITYMGPSGVYKGLNILVDSLERLRKENICNWILNLFGEDIYYEVPNMENYNINGRYNYSDLKEIFIKTDLLVVPSICKETYGFAGLEALSYGIPVMISENAGFRDLVSNGETGFIVKPSVEEMYLNLKDIINNREILKKINNNLLKLNFEYLMEKHHRDISDLYRRVIELIV